jgi:hypothetical protein
MTRVALAIVLSGLVVGSSGCGIPLIHLYREADYTAAVKARTAFTEAKIGDGLVAERTRLEALLKSELEAVRRFALARRDELLIALLAETDAKKSWERFDVSVNERLLVLLDDASAGSGTKIDEATLKKLKDAADGLRLKTVTARLKEEEMALAVHAYRIEFARGHPSDDIPTLSCPSSKDPLADIPTLTVALKAYKTACKDYLDARAGMENIQGPSKSDGLWQGLSSQVKTAEGVRATVQNRIADLKGQYKAAKDAYAAASDPKEVQEKAAALKSALDKLAKFDTSNVPGGGTLGLMGRIEALQAQLASVNKLVDGFTTGAKAGATATVDQRADVAIARTIGSLAATTEGASKIPALGVLLLESRRLELELERARGLLAVEDTRLALLKRKRTALASEIDRLRDARLQADTELSDKSNCRGKPVAADFGTSSACGQITAFALIDVADSWSEGRLVEEQVDWLLLGLRYRSSVESSEVALRQWNNLVDVPLARLVAYHESGIKLETVLALINSAVLIWIGAAQ